MAKNFITIKEDSYDEFVEKKSTFITHLIRINSEEEARDFIQKMKKKHYDATHVCSCYVVGENNEITRANDDGEPSSTAGKPILGQIDSYGLTNTLICVIRYYGGINLGTGGLIVAYREAAADALSNSEIEEKFIEEEVKYTFTYPMMNDVMRIIKEMNPRIVNQVLDNTCEVVLSIRKGQAEELRTRLKKLSFE